MIIIIKYENEMENLLVKMKNLNFPLFFILAKSEEEKRDGE